MPSLGKRLPVDRSTKSTKRDNKGSSSAISKRLGHHTLHNPLSPSVDILRTPSPLSPLNIDRVSHGSHGDGMVPQSPESEFDDDYGLDIELVIISVNDAIAPKGIVQAIKSPLNTVDNSDNYGVSVATVPTTEPEATRNTQTTCNIESAQDQVVMDLTSDPRKESRNCADSEIDNQGLVPASDNYNQRTVSTTALKQDTQCDTYSTDSYPNSLDIELYHSPVHDFNRSSEEPKYQEVPEDQTSDSELDDDELDRCLNSTSNNPYLTGRPQLTKENKQETSTQPGLEDQSASLSTNYGFQICFYNADRVVPQSSENELRFNGNHSSDCASNTSSTLNGSSAPESIWNNLRNAYFPLEMFDNTSEIGGVLVANLSTKPTQEVAVDEPGDLINQSEYQQNFGAFERFYGDVEEFFKFNQNPALSVSKNATRELNMEATELNEQHLLPGGFPTHNGEYAQPITDKQYALVNNSANSYQKYYPHNFGQIQPINWTNSGEFNYASNSFIQQDDDSTTPQTVPETRRTTNTDGNKATTTYDSQQTQGIPVFTLPDVPKRNIAAKQKRRSNAGKNMSKKECQRMNGKAHRLFVKLFLEWGAKGQKYKQDVIDLCDFVDSSVKQVNAGSGSHLRPKPESSRLAGLIGNTTIKTDVSGKRKGWASIKINQLVEKVKRIRVKYKISVSKKAEVENLQRRTANMIDELSNIHFTTEKEEEQKALLVDYLKRILEIGDELKTGKIKRKDSAVELNNIRQCINQFPQNENKRIQVKTLKTANHKLDDVVKFKLSEDENEERSCFYLIRKMRKCYKDGTQEYKTLVTMEQQVKTLKQSVDDYYSKAEDTLKDDEISAMPDSKKAAR